MCGAALVFLLAASFAAAQQAPSTPVPLPPYPPPAPVCKPAPAFDVQATSSELFLDIAVIMLVCRFIGLVFKAFGQPTVIGEIIAGILLGPSGLGQAHKCPTGSTSPTSLYPSGAPCDPFNPTLLLFPTNTPFQTGPSNIRNYLNVCAQLGVVVFMFVVGLEVDMMKLRKTSGKAGFIAFFSVAVPFLLGTFTLGPHLWAKHNVIVLTSGKDVKVDELSFKLFVGTCMSVTAFPVLARIITEKKLQKLQLGSMTLACAALNDVVAWALLAVVLAVQASSASGTGVQYAPVLRELGLIVAIVVVEFVIVAPIMRFTVLNHYKRTGSLSPNRLAWVLIGMFLSAWLVHRVGFHAMLGSFTFGLVFPRGHGTPFLYTVLSKVESFASVVLLPIFFVVTGLSIDFSALQGAGMDLLYILLVAMGGKFVGSGIAARLSGCSNRHSVAMGIMMNTRGLTEIVVLNIAKQAYILDDTMFTLLVLMAILTTVMAGPLLSIIFTRRQIIKERAAEMAARGLARGKRLKQGDARLVVLPHDLKSVPRLLDAAVCTLADGMKAHLDVCQYSLPGVLSEPSEMGTGLLRSPEETSVRDALRNHLKAVQRRGLSSSVSVATTRNVVEDALVHLHALSPQLLVTDWPEQPDERSRLLDIVVGAPCTVVMWGGGGGSGRKAVVANTAAPFEPAKPQTTSAVAATSKRPMMSSFESSESLEGLNAVSGGNVSIGSLPEMESLPRGISSKTELVDGDAPPLPPLQRLRRLMRDEAQQDAAVDAAMIALWGKLNELGARATAMLPSRLQPEANLVEDYDGADEDGEEDGDASGSPVGPGKQFNTVVSAKQLIVSPESMAVAAASSLSPVSLKVVVTGWPESPVECAAIVKFIQEVETQVHSLREKTRRISRDEAGLMPSSSLRGSLDLARSPSMQGTAGSAGHPLDDEAALALMSAVAVNNMEVNQVSVDVKIVSSARTLNVVELHAMMQQHVIAEGREETADERV